MKKYAIYLSFSDADNAFLQSLLERVDSPLVKAGCPPHLSLGGFGEGRIEDFMEIVEEVAAASKPFHIDVTGLDSFPTVSAAYLAVHIDGNLRQTHRCFHSALEKRGIQCFQDFMPKYWIPHITLTMNDEEKMNDCLKDFADAEVTGRYEVSHVELLEHMPIKILSKKRLGQNKSLETTPDGASQF